MESARRSTAAGISFSATPSIFSGTLRSCFRSRTVASIRIWSPNLTNFPDTTVSALVNSAILASVGASTSVEGVIRKSASTWCKPSGEIVRTRADCPTSVLSMSATLEPSQSRELSPDALRNGRIASETSGLTTSCFDDVCLKIVSRYLMPTNAITRTAAISPIHGHALGAHRRTLWNASVAPAVLPCQPSRSFNTSLMDW